MNNAPPRTRSPVPRRAGPAGHTVVALRGEIDIATAPALRERLNRALALAARHHRRLVIDLSGVSFCDASGLAVLVGTLRRARRLATPMCLAAPRPQVAKLLSTTGLDRSLTVHDTLTVAIDPGHPTDRPSRRGVTARTVHAPTART